MPSSQAKFLHPISRLIQLGLGTARKSYVKQREAGDRLAKFMPMPKNVSFINSNLRGLPCLWAVPKEPVKDSIIYYLHGGGYVSGSLTMYKPLIAQLAAATGLRVFALGYRLAPEHPYPAALDDAMLGFEHFLNAGVDARSLVIAGDSAGGGLLIALSQRIQKKCYLQPAALVCLSPWTDLSMSGGTIQSMKAYDPVLTEEWLRGAANAYLAGTDPKTPGASPLFGKMGGLPPMLIQVGNDEVLRDDALRMDAVATRAGVNVQLEVWPEMVHGWHMMGTWLPETVRAFKHISDFIHQYV